MTSHSVPWMEEDIQKLIELYNSGMTTELMSERLHRSIAAIAKKLEHVRAFKPDELARRKPNQKPWTAEEDSALVEHYKSGISMSAIAKAMGKTRNQIAGRVHRIRDKYPVALAPRPKRETSKKHAVNARSRLTKAERAARTAAKRRIASAKKAAAKAAKAPVVEVAAPVAPNIEPLNLRLDQMTKGQCRFSTKTDASGTHFFCGHKVKNPKSSWCAHHHNIVFTTPPPDTEDE